MTYNNLISLENLFQAWDEFSKGKLKKKDVQKFYRNLEDNLFELHRKLENRTYRHGTYQDFYVNYPKRRYIHKAEVEDRIVHHLLYKYLYEIFDKTFIFDSYSCRLNKGTHKAVKRLEKFTRKVSKNYISSCWVLKCDIKKFFAGVDHKVLLTLLNKKINDEDIIWLLEQIIYSFHSDRGEGKGMPLGNLTSQVFANIYLNELDQFIKHKLRARYYIRYVDDFLFLSNNRELLYKCVDTLRQFLEDKLRLELHPDKVIFRKLEWGIDFLGYVVLPHYILPKTKTKNRIIKQIDERFNDFRNEIISRYSFNQSLQSYLGFLKHANTFQLREELKNRICF